MSVFSTLSPDALFPLRRWMLCATPESSLLKTMVIVPAVPVSLSVLNSRLSALMSISPGAGVDVGPAVGVAVGVEELLLDLPHAPRTAAARRRIGSSDRSLI